jgi:hypothetical protein
MFWLIQDVRAVLALAQELAQAAQVFAQELVGELLVLVLVRQELARQELWQQELAQEEQPLVQEQPFVQELVQAISYVQAQMQAEALEQEPDLVLAQQEQGPELGFPQQGLVFAQHSLLVEPVVSVF